MVFVGNEIDFVKCEVFAHLRQPAEARHIVDRDVFALYILAFAEENAAGVSVCVCCECNCVAEFVFSLSFVRYLKFGLAFSLHRLNRSKGTFGVIYALNESFILRVQGTAMRVFIIRKFPVILLCKRTLLKENGCVLSLLVYVP